MKLEEEVYGRPLSYKKLGQTFVKEEMQPGRFIWISSSLDFSIRDNSAGWVIAKSTYTRIRGKVKAKIDTIAYTENFPLCPNDPDAKWVYKVKGVVEKHLSSQYVKTKLLVQSTKLTKRQQLLMMLNRKTTQI